MLGFGRPEPVPEHEATGETARIYHEIRQTLRVSGVNLVFRTWAGMGRLLPVAWEGVRANAETRAFEDAADQLRMEAAHAADALGRVSAAGEARLGESQVFQLRAALDLYRYVTPKLLLLTAAVRMALEDGRADGSVTGSELIARGVPTRMYPMEMVAEEPDEKRIREQFDDIKKTLGLSRINSVYRTLALWPDYLEPAWDGLKPITGLDEYEAAADRLRDRSRELVGTLPYPIALSREAVENAGEDAGNLLETAEKFEKLVPGVVLNAALFALDWQDAAEVARSPFPAPSRSVTPVVGGMA